MNAYTCEGPPHTYADNGLYVVTVKVTDKDGGVGQSTTTYQVNNVAPKNLILTLSENQINENEWVTVAGSFNDPGSLDTHTVTIDWKDGNISTIQLDNGERAFDISRQYLDDNPSGTPSDPYSIQVTVTDNNGASRLRSDGIDSEQCKSVTQRYHCTDRTGSDQFLHHRIRNLQ